MVQIKTYWLHFLSHFSTDQDEIESGVVAILLLIEIDETRVITAVLLTASKTINTGMHLNVYELIWFKVGMMIDTIEH